MKKERIRHRQGYVLIMALVVLAIMMLLLVALFEGTSHQLRGSQSDAYLTQEKLLADSAAALVIGQVQTASSMTASGQAWISQPGLLRTFDQTATRKPIASYKLYSSGTMTDTTGTLTFLATDVPSNWNSAANAANFTDLNASVQTPGLFGQAVYPILDPGAATTVPGMSIDAGHAVEMPVAWLYELQDGSLGAPSAATAANPIVGRVAFWTDDETSKININTAGCASIWNAPYANSTDDGTNSTTQPAAGEFVRYPGHPGGVSLAGIFGTNAPAALANDQLLGLTPRYNSGGSSFGTQATTATTSVPAKMDRLYGSVDELLFNSTSVANQRQLNPLTPGQINIARFFITAHSESPETTLLGEPRVAIWSVSDAASDTTRTTAQDQAVRSAATVGPRTYFFQRHNAQSATDDLDATVVPANATLFNELLSRGDEKVPGYGAAFTQKYTGGAWPQLMLEITDFIRGFNAVDPHPSPFVSYAAGDSTGAGTGFVTPLTATSGTTPLRGLGRCPTLSSLTLIFYVCGFGFDDGTLIDYDLTPDDAAGTSWQANFAPGSATQRWKHVKAALVRAFAVPCTFRPGCAYPEVSDACDIEIEGLDGISVKSGTTTGDFGFAASSHSRLLSDAVTVLPAQRAWGGNEGPLAWRAASIDAPSGPAYPFAGTKAFALPLSPTALLDPLTGGPSWASAWTRTLIFGGVTSVTVHIRDKNAATLQTLTLALPSFALHAPTVSGECDHADGSTPATSRTDWATATATKVPPSYYMNLRNRLRGTQLSRATMIQAGDISQSVEASTDLRVVAALPTVASNFFHAHPGSVTTAQGGTHSHNLRFADGTSVCFASGTTKLVSTAAYPTTSSSMSATDWRDGTTAVAYTWSSSPACQAPTGTTSVTMSPTQNIAGDWDTGLGFAPDGALANLPDAGTTLAPASAYFGLSTSQIGAATWRAPNALVSSPVIFGSLPAGINPGTPAQSEPWRTLLFCPNPPGGSTHPGFATPPDYLVLDHFWMPTLEPYAISTCMATAGKINLNDQIMPFTYLHRQTALRALLDDVRIPAISATVAVSYKSAGTPIASIWKPINDDATMTQLESRFTTGDAYLTEGEICSVSLVPQGIAASALDSFWNNNTGGGRLTGDNLRELPYAQLYGRLTTRSNSYTVYVRVQVLKKLPDDPNVAEWREGTDVVLGDWRGSYEIERYLDPAAPAPTVGQPLGPYRYRIVSSRRFAP